MCKPALQVAQNTSDFVHKERLDHYHLIKRPLWSLLAWFLPSKALGSFCSEHTPSCSACFCTSAFLSPLIPALIHHSVLLCCEPWLRIKSDGQESICVYLCLSVWWCESGSAVWGTGGVVDMYVIYTMCVLVCWAGCLLNAAAFPQQVSTAIAAWG